MTRNPIKTIEVPGVLKVIFDYPFDLGLPSMFFPVALEKEGEMGMIKITRLEGAQIYDKNKTLRKIVDDVGLIQIQEDESGVSQIVGYGENDLPAFHHIVGKTGRSTYPWHYSRIELVFCVSDIKSAWSGKENSTFVNEMTAKLFNKFLLAYRDSTTDLYNKYLSNEADFLFYKELFVSEFTKEENKLPTLDILTNELLEKRVYKAYFDVFNEGDERKNFSLVQGGITPYLKNNIIKKELKEANLVRFLKSSVYPRNIPVFNQVLLSAMERLLMDQDYRMTIIDCDTAFETTIIHYITAFLIKEGKTEMEIDTLFDTNTTYQSTMQRIDRLQESFDKYHTILKLPLVKIKSVQEFSDWKTFVRNRRNSASHAWKQYGEKEAKESFQHAQKYIRYVQKNS